MNKFFILFVCLVLHCNAHLNAQENEEPTHQIPKFKRLSLGFHVGDLIAHHPFMQVYQEQTIKAITLSLENDVVLDWSHAYSGISRGLEFHHTNLGSQNLLGTATHVAYFLKTNLFQRKSDIQTYKSRLSLKLGGGLGALSKRFHPEENFLNVVIGTRLNLAITSEFACRFNFGKRAVLVPFIKFTHYSNAAFRKPNLGLNLITGGIYAEFKKEKDIPPPFHSSKVRSRSKLNVFLLGGLNELKSNAGVFPNTTIGINYTHFNTAFKYGFFVDFQSNAAYRNADFLDLEKNAHLRASFGSILGLQFGRSSLNAEIGIYFRNKIPGLTPYYERIYFDHAVSDKLSIRFGIKAHGTVAETFELGITKNLLAK